MRFPPPARIRPSDLLLPVALVLWWVGARAAQPGAMDDYGLLPALPAVFFAGVGLLVGSIVAVLLRPELSPVRLGLHLVALVLMLHGTMPIIFDDPIYPWVYKHVGVVGYINLHGSLDTGVDIYHNWPGFFALAAWFTRIAGVATPLDYAAWAPVYFNLLTCLALGFVFRSLPVTCRTRWIGLFIFVAGNWVGQDYFAPQAVAFVLSLAVFGMVLAWLRAEHPVAVVRVVQRMASLVSRPRYQIGDAEGAPPSPGPPRLAARSALFFVFAAVVVTHQLSPYVVLLGLGLLAASGMVRPRWVVVGLASVAVGYLVLRLPYLERTQDLFGSLGDPFGNVNDPQADGSVVMTGRRVTALAAPLLCVCLWTLAALGVVRRLRTGRPTLVLGLLAFSPVLIALGQSYGGEAVFRIYLFSLPWVALLGACALAPRSLYRPMWPAMAIGVVLSATVVMFMSAFYGAAELYVVRPGELQASQYFYDNAEPGGVLTLLAPNFPTRVGDRYDQFGTPSQSPPVLLEADAAFRHRVLGAADLPGLSDFVLSQGDDEAGSRYFVLSTGQQVFAEVQGLLPAGSVAALDAALAAAPDWQVFHRNPDAVIYRFAPETAGQPAGERTVEPEFGPSPAARSRDRSVDLAGLGAGLAGLGAVGVVLVRRRRMATGPGEFDAEQPTMAAATRVDDLLREAMRAPAYDRQTFRSAIGEIEPEPLRFCDLVAGVPVGHRPDAVRLLVEAWGPVPPTSLRPLLEDRSAAIRAAALAAVDPSADGDGVLRRMLGDVSVDVRLAAVGALARSSESDQLDALGVALGDPDPGVRASAVETFPVMTTGRAASHVLAVAEDTDPAVRTAAYRRLVAGPDWVLWMAFGRCSRRPELLAVLDDAAGDRLAALALERVHSPDLGDRVLALELAGHPGSPALLGQAAHPLSDSEAAVRLGDATASQAEAVSAFVEVLRNDPDPTVRREAALALADVGVEAVLLGFLGALEDPDPDVRGLAGEALCRHPSPGLANRLVAELNTSNLASVGEVLLRMGPLSQEVLAAAAVKGPSERASAATNLLRRSDPTPHLLAELSHVNPDRRLQALELLGALGSPAAQDGLIAALSDPRPEIRSRAARCLGQVIGEGSRQACQKAKDSEPVPEVPEDPTEARQRLEERTRTARP